MKPMKMVGYIWLGIFIALAALGIYLKFAMPPMVGGDQYDEEADLFLRAMYVSLTYAAGYQALKRLLP